MKLKELLKTYHGPIGRIFISYSKEDSPEDRDEYDKWFEETNKVFDVDMDLFNSDQKIEDFKVLEPYLNKKVSSWSSWETSSDLYHPDDDITIFEVDLY